MAARMVGAAVTVTCKGAVAVTDGFRLSLSRDFPDVATALTVTKGGQLLAPRPLASRATPSPDSWEALSRLAYRTYAPSTEESRILGAGAGLSDND